MNNILHANIICYITVNSKKRNIVEGRFYMKSLNSISWIPVPHLQNIVFITGCHRNISRTIWGLQTWSSNNVFQHTSLKLYIWKVIHPKFCFTYWSLNCELFLIILKLLLSIIYRCMRFQIEAMLHITDGKTKELRKV